MAGGKPLSRGNLCAPGGPFFPPSARRDADAGLREGLRIQAAYVHDLNAANRESVDVSPVATAASEQTGKPRWPT